MPYRHNEIHACASTRLSRTYGTVRELGGSFAFTSSFALRPSYFTETWLLGKATEASGILPAPCGPDGLPAGRCPGGAGSARATGTRSPLPLCCGVACSNPSCYLQCKNAQQRLFPLLSVFLFLGQAGFEPTTPCTPCKCATRLRYCPLFEVSRALQRVDVRSIHAVFRIVNPFFS